MVLRGVFFFIVVGGFFLLRSSTDLVWNDSATANSNPIIERLPLVWGQDGFFSRVVSYSFFEELDGGFRPISTLIRNFMIFYVRAHDGVPYAWFFVFSVIIGLAAMAIFLVARQLTHSDRVGYGSVFLFYCSPPFLAGSWVSFAGIQSLVPLVLCGGIWAFQKRYWSLLVALLIVGPWIREFCGLLPILIFALNYWGARRPWLMVVAAAGLLHAFFPTVILHLFWKQLPVAPVFQLGYLGQQVSSGSFLRPEAFFQMISFAPALSILFVFVSWFRWQRERIFRNSSFLFLSFWFALSFLPFLKVFTSHVHLAYCLVPLSILVAWNLNWFYESICIVSRKKAAVFASLVCFLFLDHGLNLVASVRIVRSINEGIQDVSRWFRENATDQPIVISNALHAEDISWFARDRIHVMWTVEAGVPRPQESLTTDQAAIDFVSSHRSRAFYLLDMDYLYEDYKRGYHSHGLVRRNVFRSKRRYRRKTQVRYLFLDPLKRLVSRRYTPFLGSPDLENDFYRGPDRQGRFFVKEVYVDYAVYEVLF